MLFKILVLKLFLQGFLYIYLYILLIMNIEAPKGKKNEYLVQV
jgi:hypothetical protein